MLQFCSVSNSLSHTTLSIKWEVYFSKEVSSLVFTVSSLWFIHASAYEYVTWGVIQECVLYRNNFGIYIYIYIKREKEREREREKTSPRTRKVSDAVFEVKYYTGVQSQVASYQRLFKRYMMPPSLTLSNIRYVLRVKWSNHGKGVAPSPTPRCSSYWKGSLLDTFDYLLTIQALLKNVVAAVTTIAAAATIRAAASLAAADFVRELH